MLASRQQTGGTFIPDYSVSIDSIPDHRRRKGHRGTVRPRGRSRQGCGHRDNSEALGDQYFVPGVGKIGGVYVHIIGAETLKAGNPRNVGWIPAFLVALALCSLAVLKLAHGGQRLFVRIQPSPFFSWRRSRSMRSCFTSRPRRPCSLPDCLVGTRLADDAAARAGQPPFRVCPTSTRSAPIAPAATRRSSLPGCSTMRKILATLPADSERELVGRSSRVCGSGDPERVLLPGRRRHFCLVRGSSAPVRKSYRCASRAVPQPGASRRPADRPVGRLRGRDRQQPLAFEPSRQRAGRSRGSRAARD